MDTRVKICGLKTPEAVASAVEAGAQYLGFVFFEKSPRNVSVPVARDLALDVPVGVAKVALVVNATDEELDRLMGEVPVDMLQLHGAEDLERVKAIRARYGLPVMKAVGVSTPQDIQALDAYGLVSDQVLVDAKAPKGAALPGGNGLSFDWRLISKRGWNAPWMLAGGLTPDNVVQAIQLTGAKQVDVSSGVESAPGVKDPVKIRAFIKAIRAA
ncbi:MULTISPECIES: phosphoribosylanthranilate isomerase [Pacificibacter]|uniref:phosphoribosylanthranilate isomerase n=1 Tax=Pacificibacter TaxID=1042323 RepID=UPI001C081C5B|nr:MULTISPECIES: phosphoribosylanthranilate isomerase [Pacificibacter]MBU2934608.1 phosphoribosylanthranilate isomerase [Pacificibacter marinus]MDO6616948.1 phosphoribosylanthranilate isomerase [Pacificibacter sp. 1_MG-2023]